MKLDIKKVLISDPTDEVASDLLRQRNVIVDKKVGLNEQQLIEIIKDYDGLIVRSATRVTAAIIKAAKNLKVIGRAGVGVDNIDVEAASEQGVLVINAPGGNTIAAAELTCIMITALSRHIVPACMKLKNMIWDKKSFMGSELMDKTLVIIGLGRIGREVARRMQAFGMKTLGYDPLVPADVSKSFGVESLELEKLWSKADYITLHVPLIPQTKGLINAQTLNLCKKGVKIVNCSRGGVVDESALLDALNSGHCSGAALDVFEEEPPKNKALLEHPNLICTPHLGASTKEAQVKVAEEISQQFLQLIDGLSIPGAVNANKLKK